MEEVEQELAKAKTNFLNTLTGKITAGFAGASIIVGLPLNAWLASNIGESLGARVMENTEAVKSLKSEVQMDRLQTTILLERATGQQDKRLITLEERVAELGRRLAKLE
jgi:hypothetical protein